MSRKKRTQPERDPFGLTDLLTIRAAAPTIPDNFRIEGASEGFELTAQDAGEGKPALKRFSMTAYTGGTMSLGWGPPVVVDLEGISVPRQANPILKSHDQNKIVGHTDKVEVSAQRIKVSGVISGVGEAAQEVTALAGNGFPWQASIGASVQAREFVDAGQSVKVNGRMFAGPVIVARKTTLGEVSFVSIGADQNTSATVAASRKSEVDMNFSQWLRARGLDEAKLSDSEKTVLRAAFDAEQKIQSASTGTTSTTTTTEGAAKPDPVDEQNERIAANLERVALIEAECKEYPDIAATAIKEKWTVEKTKLAVREKELEKLRADRPNVGPAIISANHDKNCTAEALGMAMILRSGGRLDLQCYQGAGAVALKLPSALRAGINAENKQRAMEYGHKFSNMSLLDICAESLRLDGKDVPSDRTDMIRAAFSGSALTQIFTTSVNAMLLASYTSEGDTTQGWVKEADVADFKTQDRPRVLVGPGMSRLPRGGTADDASYQDVNEAYKIRRYAKKFTIDEQDMIDDAMGVFADTPARLGQAAAWLRPDLVYSILIDNDALDATSIALFHADQDQGTGLGNLDTSSALAAPTLKIGISRMSLFTENSRNLNLRATHLIVPPTLIWTARELIESAEMDFGGDDETSRGNKNVLQGQLSVVSDARLENGVTDPVDDEAQTGSAVHWYLACSNAHTIEVGYLRGTGRAPQVRSFVLSQGQWGMGWDVKMDIGAKALDWKGLYKGEG